MTRPPRLAGYSITKVIETVTVTSAVPGRTGVGASPSDRSPPKQSDGAENDSTIEATPVMLTPAALASVSARARASRTAASRACRSAVLGSATRKVMPLTVVAPAATESSMTGAS
ncbi:MAG: hypothetical protein WD830_02575 [Chloroflexota bacterium]